MKRPDKDDILASEPCNGHRHALVIDRQRGVISELIITPRWWWRDKIEVIGEVDLIPVAGPEELMEAIFAAQLDSIPTTDEVEYPSKP